jgi:hypothetical protein
MSTTGYNLVVKRPIELLTLLIERLCGDAQMSLEGDVTYVDTREIPSSRTEPTALLSRSTTHPIEGFIILPIEPNTKEQLIHTVLPQAGLRTRINHVQIQKNGVRMFAAHDRFDVDCVWIGAWVEETWLMILVEQGIIRSYARLGEA